ncbi:TPA: ABC transporter ATP-binding protein [Clostridium botulinum]|nr:ABC transporter ATP-binding protein [Clostridium botulinum]
MIGYLSKYKIKCLFIVLLSFLLGSMDVFKGIALKLIVDTSVGNLNYTFQSIFLIIVAFTALNFLTYFLFQKTIYLVSTNVMCDIKNDILKTIIYNEEYTVDENNMDILSLMNKDIDITLDKYFLNIFLFIRILISLLMSLAYLLYVNIALTVIILVLGSISVILPNFFVKKSSQLKEVYSKSNSIFFNSVKELLYGFNTIRLYGIEKCYFQKNKDANNSIEKARFDTLLFDSLIQIISSCVGFLVLSANVVLTGYLSYKGYFTIGTVLAVMQVMNYVLAPLSQGPVYYAEIKSARCIINKVKNHILPYSESETTNIIDQHIENITISDMCFKYPTADRDVLSNIDIVFEDQKKYAIVGASGCGKTTLVKLLSKIEKNYTGEIKVNGMDFKNISPKLWRNKISVISQDIFLFDNTLKYNICLDNSIDDAQLKGIIEKVGLTNFVNSLPQGVNSPIGENGTLISGGEKQRISIARALVKNAEILLVDEATSSLDKKNANNIDNIILSLDKLAIVITHKYDEKLLKCYNSILVMDNGEIVEKGEFSDLMHEESKLYNLLNVLQENVAYVY